MPRSRSFGPVIQRRIATIFPGLGKVAISDVFGGAVGVTVHGMPQIGQLRKGLWVASGFGRHGLNTSAMAGQVIARSILWGDERWKLFSPFELVWAGGATGRVAGHLIGLWGRGHSAAAGALARYREGGRAVRHRADHARCARSLRDRRKCRTEGYPPLPRRKVRKSGTDPCNVGAS